MPKTTCLISLSSGIYIYVEYCEIKENIIYSVPPYLFTKLQLETEIFYALRP